MGKVIPLTLNERKKIKYLIDQMVPQNQIAMKLGRASSCINTEIRRSGDRDLYDPDIAHQNARARNEKKIEALKNIYSSKKHINKIDLELRISNLEMQIEIIIEQIKELLNDRIN